MKIRKISVVFMILCVLGFGLVLAFNQKINNPTTQSRIEENSRLRVDLEEEIGDLIEEKQALQTQLTDLNTKIKNKQSIQGSLHELNNKLKGESL